MLHKGSKLASSTYQQQQRDHAVLCSAGRHHNVAVATEAPVTAQRRRRRRVSTSLEEHLQQQSWVLQPAQQQQRQLPMQQPHQPYAIQGSPRDFDSLLTSMITSAVSWHDLRSIYSMHQQNFSPIHTAAALSKLAKLCTQRSSQRTSLDQHPRRQQHEQQRQLNPEQLLEAQGFATTQLVPQLLSHGSDISPRVLANSIWALSKLKVVPQQQDLTLLLQRLEAVVAGLEPQHISSLLYAFAQWHVQQQQECAAVVQPAAAAGVSSSNNGSSSNSSRAWSLQQQQPRRQQQQAAAASAARLPAATQPPTLIPAHSIDLLMAAAANKLQLFGPQALSNTLYAAALLQYTPNDSWLTHFWYLSTHSMAAAEQQHLSNMAWAAATLGLQPPASWRDSWIMHSTTSLQDAAPQGLSNSIWAVAKLGWGADALQPVNAVNSSSSSSRVSSVEDISWLSSFCDVCVGQLSGFTDQGLSNCCWALGTVAQQLKQQQQQQVIDSPAVRLTGDASYSAPLSLLQQQLLQSGLWQQLLQQLEPRLLGFNPQQFSNTIWGLASICCSSSKHSSSSGYASSSALTSSTRPLAHQQQQQRAGFELQLELPDSWLETFVRASGPKLMQFQPQELSNVLISFARLHCKPASSWMTLSELVLCKHMNTCDSQVLSNAAWAMVQLQRQPSDAWWSALLQEACSRVTAAASATADGEAVDSLGSSSRGGAFAFTAQGLSVLLLSLSQLATAANHSSSSSSSRSYIRAGFSTLWAAVGKELASTDQHSSNYLSGYTSQGLCYLAGAAAMCEQQRVGQQLLLVNMQLMVQRQQRQPRSERRKLFQGLQQTDQQAAKSDWQLEDQVQPEAGRTADASGSSSSRALADVSMLLWAAAKLDWQPPIDLLVPLLDQALRAVQCMSQGHTMQLQQYSNTSGLLPASSASSSSSSGDRSSIVLDDLRVSSAGGVGLKYLGALMYALGYTGFDPGSVWFDRWFTATEPLLQQCSCWTLVMLLWGALWLEVVPPSCWTRAWAAAWRKQQQQQELWQSTGFEHTLRQQELVSRQAVLRKHQQRQQMQHADAVAAHVAVVAARKGFEVAYRAAEAYSAAAADAAGARRVGGLRDARDLHQLCRLLVNERPVKP